MKGPARWACLASGAVCLAFGLGPWAVYGYFHAGCVVLTLVGGVSLALPLLWRWRLGRLAGAGVALFWVAQGVFAGVMIPAAQGPAPPDQTPVTVVVLGCAVRGDAPSRMLALRLEAALAWLELHPGPVVVTGGRGAGQAWSEAQVEAMWLEAKGVDPARIWLEDASTNTQENLENTAAILEGEGLPRQVLIASDGFHQFRGALYARRAGLDPYPLASSTPWGLLPGYWVREELAILRALVQP